MTSRLSGRRALDQLRSLRGARVLVSVFIVVPSLDVVPDSMFRFVEPVPDRVVLLRMLSVVLLCVPFVVEFGIVPVVVEFGIVPLVVEFGVVPFARSPCIVPVDDGVVVVYGAAWPGAAVPCDGEVDVCA